MAQSVWVAVRFFSIPNNTWPSTCESLNTPWWMYFMSQSTLNCLSEFNETKLPKGDRVWSSQLTTPATSCREVVFCGGVNNCMLLPQRRAQMHITESSAFDSGWPEWCWKVWERRNWISSREGSFLLTRKGLSKQTQWISYKAKDLLQLSDKTGKLMWLTGTWATEPETAPQMFWCISRENLVK